MVLKEKKKENKLNIQNSYLTNKLIHENMQIDDENDGENNQNDNNNNEMITNPNMKQQEEIDHENGNVYYNRTSVIDGDEVINTRRKKHGPQQLQRAQQEIEKYNEQLHHQQQKEYKQYMKHQKQQQHHQNEEQISPYDLTYGSAKSSVEPLESYGASGNILFDDSLNMQNVITRGQKGKSKCNCQKCLS